MSCGNIFERTFLHQRQRLIGACRACSFVLSVCLVRLWRRALCRQRLAAVAEKPASSPLIPAKPPIQPVRVWPRRRCAAPWRSYGVCSRSLDAVLGGCAPVATPPRQSQTVTRRHASRVDDGVVLRRPADRRVNGGRRQGCHVPTACAGRWVEVGRRSTASRGWGPCNFSAAPSPRGCATTSCGWGLPRRCLVPPPVGCARCVLGASSVEDCRLGHGQFVNMCLVS